MSTRVCDYCGCPPRVDPGCPSQTIACASGCPPPSPKYLGLPMWIIALIIILIILIIGGIGLIMSRKSM